MKYIISFGIDFIVFLIIFLIFYLFYLKRKSKDINKLKENTNINNFINKYDLDMTKTKYKTVLYTLAFNNSLIIAFTSALITNIKGYGLKILVSLLVLMILIYSVYEVSGRILKKKEGKKKCTTSKK